MPKVLHSLRDPSSPTSIALRNFTSQWFLIPQGSGIIAVILHQLDYRFNGLTIISEILWVYTIVLLVVMLLAYLLRIALFPKEVAQALSSSISETACLASIAITYTSIIQMTALTLVHDWGPGWGTAAYVLWWTNTAMSAACCIGIPYVFVKYEPPGLSGVTPAMQLPLIAALTSAAGGGVICRYGALSDRLQVPVIIVSYLFIGMALPLALGLDTVFLTRLFQKSSPKGSSIYQEMILCGPWGQGSFALQALGAAVMRHSFAGYAKGVFLTAEAAAPVGFSSIFAGLCAWGQGTFWWAFAVVSIVQAAFEQRNGLKGMKFGLPAWSVVFPWGVYTNAAVELGKLLDSPAFKVWSTALAIMLVVIWIINTLLTIKVVITGTVLGLDHGWKRAPYENDETEKKKEGGEGETEGRRKSNDRLDGMDEAERGNLATARHRSS